MQIFTTLEQLAHIEFIESAVTIGNFDGVHLGHQKLIHSVVQKAKASRLTSVVITFAPHPEHFFAHDTPPLLLMSLDDKIKAIASLEVDILVILPFTEEIASQSPEEFVTALLVNIFHVKHLSIGYDYAFGKGRKGNAEVLAELGRVYNFSLEQIPALVVAEQTISSTRIRGDITSGCVKKAATLLGRPYTVSGTVIHGKNRGGKLLGFPTANIAFDANILVPKPGVYAVRCMFEAQQQPLLRGLGTHNTVKRSKKGYLESANDTLFYEQASSPSNRTDSCAKGASSCIENSSSCADHDSFCVGYTHSSCAEAISSCTKNVYPYTEDFSLAGVASIGLNPTFGDVPLSLEVYLLDFDKDIYDVYLYVSFIERLRDEVKFSSIEALIAQITEDTAKAREVLHK